MPRLCKKRKAAVEREKRKKFKYSGNSAYSTPTDQSSEFSALCIPDIAEEFLPDELDIQWGDMSTRDTDETPFSPIRELISSGEFMTALPVVERETTGEASYASEYNSFVEGIENPLNPYVLDVSNDWEPWNGMCSSEGNSNLLHSELALSDGSCINFLEGRVEWPVIPCTEKNTTDVYIEESSAALPDETIALIVSETLATDIPFDAVSRPMQQPLIGTEGIRPIQETSSSSVSAQDVNANHFEPDENLLHGLFSVSKASIDHSDNYNGSRSSKYAQLSRSKTIFVEIPAEKSDTEVDQNLECSCDACLKWISYNNSNKVPDVIGCNTDQPIEQATSNELRPQSEKIRNMSEVYRSLRSIKSKRRYKNRGRYVLKTALHNSKPIGKVSTKRIQAIDSDKYSEVEIPHWNHIDGRRIVDYDYFLKWILTTQAFHSQQCVGILCPLQEDFQSMVSTVFLKCNVCDTVYKGSSEKPTSKNRLRLSVVWAVLCSGGTHGHAHELFSFLDIPFMSRQSFVKDEVAMDDVIELALEESTTKAVQEEKYAVLQELEKQGISHSNKEPVESGAALDGSWGQRSNGHRYNSASGCAAIMGLRTKKVCFVGCRNKRCIACSLNVQRNKRNLKQHKHKCYRNYKGASGGMEPHIIIEGFKKLQSKGIKFTTVVTDGDSTTVARLKNSCQYGHEIRQQLCCNNATKSCGKKLREIKCPKQYLQAFQKSIDRTTRGIRSAIKHCADNTNGQDVDGLRQDIRNAPFHAFGIHHDCRDYFCVHKNEPSTETSIVPELQKLGIWDKILVSVEKMAAKAEFLSENRTSNLVENLFCRLSKYNVGKRIDTMSRGSYQRRVYITTLQHNENYSWHDKYMKMYTGDAPGFWMKKMIREKLKTATQNKAIRQSPGFTRRKKTNYDEVEQDYGEDAVAAAEELSQTAFNLPDLLKQYEVLESTRQMLANDVTITQMEEYCLGRILTRYVPDIISSRDNTKLKKCDTLLQTTNSWNFLKSNRSIVGLVIRFLKEDHGLIMGGTKLLIDTCHSYLCCAPDAISDDGSMILLVKKKDTKSTIKDIATKPGNTLGCKLRKGDVIPDKNTIIEAQAAMHTCKAVKCVMVFINAKNHTDYLLKIIDHDADFFDSKIGHKLSTFFENHLAQKVYEKHLPVKK